MLCEYCIEEHKTSKVSSHGGTSTLMDFSDTHYWDEHGVEHFHDGNTKTHIYSCSNGHEWMRKGIQPCPVGDFGHWETIKIEPDELRRVFK